MFKCYSKLAKKLELLVLRPECQLFTRVKEVKGAGGQRCLWSVVEGARGSSHGVPAQATLRPCAEKHGGQPTGFQDLG